MRKIILGLAVSLDNRIEGPNGEYDWCFTDQDYGMTDFLGGIDAIFYGRKSYELMIKAPDGLSMFGGKTSYVFTRNAHVQFADATVINKDIETEINIIKSQPGKNIWLFGGAALTNTLLELNLVDEFWFSIHPIVLGKGKLLFDDLQSRIHTKLIDTKVYDTGLVSLRYTVIK